MNSLKPILVIAVLGGIGYGVYTRVNTPPSAPPPGVPESWNSPSVQVGGDPSGPDAKWGSLPGAAPAPPAGPAVASFGGSSTTATTTAPAFPGAVNPGSVAPYTQAQPVTPVAPDASNPAGPEVTGIPPTAQQTQAAVTIPTQGGAAAQSSPADYANSIPDALRQSPLDPAAQSAPGTVSSFATAMEAAHRELDAGHLAEAHKQLSVWYDDPRLSAAEQQRLTELLDQIAGTVIYSTQPLLEPPYEVQSGERLEDIGRMYNVPWQLLAKINGIDDPQSLRAGERLKVVRGPFSADVNLEKHQLVLKLNGAYAGQFSISVARESAPPPGDYTVTERVANPIYRGPDRTVEADDPANPLGEHWIGLGGQYGIHGTNDPSGVARNDLPNCIGLSRRDAEDVFYILGENSKVVIRR